MKKVKKGNSPRWKSNWKAMAYQTWSLTTTLRAACRLHDKLTFLFKSHHARRPNVRLVAQELRPSCCRQNIGGKIDTTFHLLGKQKIRKYIFVLRLETLAARVQSFTLWQQETIEITRRDHCIILPIFATYIWVFIVVHILFVVNCTFNATPTERLLQHTLFCNKPHR